jgi:hypothetical protein
MRLAHKLVGIRFQACSMLMVAGISWALLQLYMCKYSHLHFCAELGLCSICHGVLVACLGLWVGYRHQLPSLVQF